MPAGSSKQVNSTRKKQSKLQVVDVDPVLVLNRRGNRVYRPRPVVVEKELIPHAGPSNNTTSGEKRRRAPSDTVAEIWQGSADPSEIVNKNKKKKIGGRKTMVRANRIVLFQSH